MRVRTSDNPGLSRYEVYADDRLVGFADYRVRDDRMSIMHTETNPELRGRGLASALVKDTLELARARELSVLPLCPFVSAFIRRNPEYLPLVPAAERDRFGLPA